MTDHAFNKKDLEAQLNRLPFPHLMDELKDYADANSLYFKVRRIHTLCIRARKLQLADKIKAKYPQYFRDDMAIAMGWALAGIRL
jgi:hypothetical protein